ncbi:putative CRAL-TRIO lipid binding domain, Macro domain, CRAL-TRIO lipid binding domain superfamily [Helianthus annuus]|nr:putative CRAL-TRIO lipid binding domain, Macro domain, CRAL-TRIO lipid binding domain superfamily [Helianthus annuus]
MDAVVTLDQVPRWSHVDLRSSYQTEDPRLHFRDPLTVCSEAERNRNGMVSRFPVDHEINSKIYLWRGTPWNLEVDAVVNSTNEEVVMLTGLVSSGLAYVVQILLQNMDKAHCSPGLHAAAGPGLAEECTTMDGCRTGMAIVTNAYDLPARKIIHTVGPKYAVKYHTAAENALSHCYRSCLELLIENRLKSIAIGCIYTEAKHYPREPAAHVAIRTIRRFLEKQKDKITGLVFCINTENDTDIYKRLLPLYFPRDKHEEKIAITKLPADVGDENGETIIDERKIRIKPLPNMKKTVSKPPQASVDVPASDRRLVRRNSSYLDSYLDPAFMSLIKDPDQRHKERLKKTSQAQNGFNFAKLLGFGDVGGPPLSAAEEYSLHSSHLAKANSLNLSEIAEMKIVYRGGVDNDGRPVMVVVGAHFLLRCLDLEKFVLYVIKEFEPLIQKSYTIVYLHSAASLQVRPDLGWMRKLQQILGRKSQHNLHAIYVLHPTFGLKAAVFAMQLLVDGTINIRLQVWKKVIYVDRLLHLFRYVPREQLTIPDFVFQHDLEVNGGKGMVVDPRRKYAYQRP